MNYLVYIERAAENLQFFLWYRDYSKRFAELPSAQQALAPAWTVDKSETDASASYVNAGMPKGMTSETAAIFKDTDFAGPKVAVIEYNNDSNPFFTPPQTPDGGKESTDTVSERSWSPDNVAPKDCANKSFRKIAAEAFEAADVKLQPC